MKTKTKNLVVDNETIERFRRAGFSYYPCKVYTFTNYTYVEGNFEHKSLKSKVIFDPQFHWSFSFFQPWQTYYHAYCSYKTANACLKVLLKILGGHKTANVSGPEDPLCSYYKPEVDPFEAYTTCMLLLGEDYTCRELVPRDYPVSWHFRGKVRAETMRKIFPKTKI